MQENRYTATAMTLHWLIALLIFIAFPVGLIMSEMAFSPFTLKLFSWHKWVGVTVFALALIRLTWRLTHPVPQLPIDMVSWEKILAHAVHIALYILLFAIPLSGWLMSSAKGFQTVYLGLFPIPDLIAKNPALGEKLEQAHALLNWLLLSLVVLHILGALKHYFIDRNDILARMLPIAKRNSQR